MASQASRQNRDVHPWPPWCQRPVRLCTGREDLPAVVAANMITREA